MQFLFTKTPLLFLVQNLWRDEAFSYLLAKKGIIEIMSLTVQDFSPPLYYILLHYWMKIFGTSEIALRSLSIIFYWATIYIAFLFLTNIFKLTTKKSLIFLVLFIINPVLVYYAFEVRMYTMFSFLATYSFYEYYKLCKTSNKSKRQNVFFYLIPTILGLYTHYFMIFVVASQFLFFLIRKKLKLESKNTKKLLMNFLIIGLSFLPWVIFVLFQRKLFNESFWIEKESLKSILSFFAALYSGYGKEFITKEIFTIISFSIFVLFVIIFGIINIQSSKKDQKDIFLYLVIWSLLIPISVILISFIKPIFLTRYLIFSTVGFILLLILLFENIKSYKLLYIVLIICLFLNTFRFQQLQIKNRKKTNINKTIKDIRLMAGKNDVIYVKNYLDFHKVQYYFDENRVFIYGKSYEEIPNYIGKALISKTKIAKTIPIYPKKAFILNHNNSFEIATRY